MEINYAGQISWFGVVGNFPVNSITKIWHSSPPTSDSFGSLKEIKLFHCDKFKATYLCPHNLTQLKSFNPEKHTTKWSHLKTLKVDSCGELEIMTSKFSKSQKTSSARDLHDTIQQPLFFLEKVQI